MKFYTNKYIRFFAAILCIVFFITVAAPMIKKLPAASDVFNVIDEKNIDATPLFYTEIEN